MASKNYLIHDKWLDIDKENNVEIQSIDGVITSVKNNGEDIGSGGGGGDFLSTAEVTIVNNAYAKIHMPICLDSKQSMADSYITESGTYTAILYKGMCYCSISEGHVTVEGDIIVEYDEYYITGDCTITIS